MGKIGIFHVASSRVTHLRMRNVGRRWRTGRCSVKCRHLEEVSWVVIDVNLNNDLENLCSKKSS